MSKKIIALILGIILISAFAGCAENSDNNSSDVSTKSFSDNKISKSEASGEITLDDVMNHETSPEEDFEWSAEEENSATVGLASYKGNQKIAVVPETLDGRPVTKVDQWAINLNTINDMSNLRGIKFADSITEFEEMACIGHNNLEIVVLGKGTKTIGQGAFQDCTALKEVVLNDGLETIMPNAFANCESLKSITIPESVKTMNYAFDSTQKDLTIYGKSGSVAEEIAKAEGINFVVQ